ncbi:hypothetical protein ACFRFL_41255 [Streptomyces sp. NPDC056708]
MKLDRASAADGKYYLLSVAARVRRRYDGQSRLVPVEGQVVDEG